MLLGGVNGPRSVLMPSVAEQLSKCRITRGCAQSRCRAWHLVVSGLANLTGGSSSMALSKTHGPDVYVPRILKHAITYGLRSFTHVVVRSKTRIHVSG